MGRRALALLPLQALVKLAVPLLRRAQHESTRSGPGRPPVIPDWVLGTLIMVAVLKKKKTKSAQYTFLSAHRKELSAWLGNDAFPCRSTYFARYRTAHRLFQAALRLQGLAAIRAGLVNARCVAADKSLLHSRGPLWHQKQRRAGVCPPGVDREATWTYSEHHGWVQGYSYEVVVTAPHRGVTFPVLASVEQAHVREHRTFPAKIKQLPGQVKDVLVDGGYDSNAMAEECEFDAASRRTGHRYLCPAKPVRRAACRRWRETKERQHHRRLREQRQAYFQRPEIRRRYARRSKTVEPFNEHLKQLFELHDQVWHRGLDNNRTQLLAAIFCYQLLVRRNLLMQKPHSRVKALLDTL
jgi:hypothetical protein